MTGDKEDDLVDPSDIDGSFRPRRAPSVAYTELDGETVLYDEATQGTHLLNPTAGLLWQCFEGDVSLDELAAEVAEAYGIDPAAAADDVLTTARSLGELGVLSGVRGTAVGPSATDAAEEPGDDGCD